LQAGGIPVEAVPISPLLLVVVAVVAILVLVALATRPK
jgi:hypothetical protein